ncbi:ADP-ribosylation factor-related protein 1 isoform X3 [Carettochelys insculpta]|uniref:ADP-ribosylation factor-related protein 1 isoform X3 n=1 Tax=Carettochelys insculpta TaxID=44489 RepID=UPI003EBFD75A
MYTLLSGLYKYMFRRDEYCILILGLDNAGKTVCALLACQHRRHKPLHSLFPRSTTMRAKTNLFPGVASVISVVLLQTFLEQTKTRFNRAYKGMSLSKITTTVGLNIGTIDVGKARLMFWDLGGQDELQSLWDKYYAESHGVIYVIDSTDEERLSESKRAFAVGAEAKSICSHWQLKGTGTYRIAHMIKSTRRTSAHLHMCNLMRYSLEITDLQRQGEPDT